MGFTLYWTRPHRVISYEKFQAAAKACKKACQKLGVPITMEHDSMEPPIFTKDTIRFNGIRDDGCETFLVKRTDAEEGNFCKTGQLPYNECVEVCLVILRDQLGFSIKSDGRDPDQGLTGFEKAEAFVKEVLV